MHLLDLWQHRKTGDLVRIEMRRSGLLSFSRWAPGPGVEGHWVMDQNVWDEVQFRRKFRRVFVTPASDLPS